jgi:hypothetical protein
MPAVDPSIKTKTDVEAAKRAAVEALPPPGDERREVLKKRLEALNVEAEKIASELGIERADPARLREDREARYAYEKLAASVDDDVPISNRQPGFHYACVWRDPFGRLGNRVVFSYIKDGWEVVKGDMPEARDCPQMGPCSERYYADTILMRIPVERYEAMRRKNLALRIAREEGVPADLLEKAARHGVKATYGELPSHIASQIMTSSDENMRPRRDDSTRRAMAQAIALNKLDRAIRAGTLHQR